LGSIQPIIVPLLVSGQNSFLRKTPQEAARHSVQLILKQKAEILKLYSLGQ